MAEARKTRRGGGSKEKGSRKVTGPAESPPPPSVAAQLSQATPDQVAAAQRKYVQGMVARGEAVEAGKPMPPGATHQIVGYEPDGTPILKRVRFSLR
jgi:hypothetical protein